MRRPSLALFLSIGLWPGATMAQGQSWGGASTARPAARVTDSDIIAMIDDGMAALNIGDLDRAYDRFIAANAITFDSDGFGLTALHLPNLALARYAMKTEDWSELSRFAASVATALDVAGFRDHPMRLEAMTFQGVAAYFEDRLNEADLILRAAFTATQGRPDMAAIHDLGHFYLALTALQSAAPDATPLRQTYLEGDPAPGGWVTPAQVAFLFYVDVFQARGQGDSPAALMAYYQEFLDLIDGQVDIEPQRMSFYRGFLGLLQFESGAFEAALGTFQRRHDFLVANDLIDDDFLFNVQRLAMARRNGGDVAGAYDFLAETMAFVRQRIPVSGIYSVFERDMGDIQVALGHPDLAQLHYRAAYTILRETRPATDSEVLAVRPLIDLDAPGIGDFAFVDELHAAAEQRLDLAEDGVPVLSQFFQGRYLNLDVQLGRLNAEGRGDDPVFLTNRALYFALTGYRDRALADLAAAAVDGAMADLVELVARVWGADAEPAAALDTVARLTDRIGDLDPARQSAARALIAFTAFRMDDTAVLHPAMEDWLTMDVPDDTALWHRFAMAIMVEMATAELDPDRTATLVAAFAANIAQEKDLPLLQDYGQVMALTNSQDALGGADVVVELGGLLRRMQARVPPHHAFVSVTQFALSNAFQWRGDTEQALIWLDRTTTTLRRHPFHNRDVLAFALSEQARLLIELGRTDRAALIAREAYEMVDPRTGRPGVVSAVVGNFAYALLSRTEDRERVAGIYARHLDDPAYADRIPPIAQVRQLLSYADVLAETAEWDAVRDVLDRAQRAMPDNGMDLRGWQATIDWTRAIAEYRYDQPAYGYHNMKRSNETLTALQNDLRAAGGVEVARAAELRNRASWTALIGWEYAQTLNP